MSHEFRRTPPTTLSARARRFVFVHGVWLDVPAIDGTRRRWESEGVPSPVADRMVAYQTRWGGLVLPPSPVYDGGPGVLCAGNPDWEDAFAEPGWWFEAGPQRTALPYAYVISPDGGFGLAKDDWVPLHATIEGWIESLALAFAAASAADTISRLHGEAVADLDLSGMQPVRETAGVNDTWWHRTGSLVAVYDGEAELFDCPAHRTAHVYSGDLDPRRL